MAEHDAPTDDAERSPGAEHCHRCGAPAERGQLVCLECGSRIALTHRRAPSWKVPVAITAVIVALSLLGAVVAVAALGDEAEREVAAAPPRPQSSDRATKEKAPPPAKKEKAPPPAKKEAASPAGRDATSAKPGAATDIVRRGALYAWPASLVGFTVVLNTAEDRASATTFAESAAKSRPAKIGVIRADDFRTLPKGFYVVFAGYYQGRPQAEEATARLGKRFSGAFTQRVTR